MMKIGIVTPAPAGANNGNRATAERWCGLLVALGHQVEIIQAYASQDYDLMIAIHAWRSSQSMRDFRQCHPQRPLLLLLAGTDLSRYLHSDPDVTHHSMALADGLIGLHDEVAAEIPPDLRARLMIVYQSAQAPPARVAPREDCFEICVVGHLRDEKDSLLAAEAVRQLPHESRLQVQLLGRATDDDWQQRAEVEQRSNRRFVWRGEVAPEQVREAMARARLMVISSRAEGGANVVSEACVAGLPVIASDIPGNRGLLGRDYPGYFPVGDSNALRQCLLRAETDPAWLAQLQRRCQEQAKLFTPEAESAALARAIAKVTEAQQG